MAVKWEFETQIVYETERYSPVLSETGAKHLFIRLITVHDM